MRNMRSRRKTDPPSEDAQVTEGVAAGGPRSAAAQSAPRGRDEPDGTVRITDTLITAIARDIGSVPPERGGALLGFGGLLHLFVADTSGVYSPGSWDISAELSTAIAHLESHGCGVLAGTVHSHPTGVVDPSATDLRTTGIALDMNPHLDRLVIAVVTAGSPRAFDVPISASHRMSLHWLRRNPAGGAHLFERVRAEIVPVGAHLREAGLAVTSTTSVATVEADVGELPIVLNVQGRDRLLIALPTEQPRALLIDHEHPVVGPLFVTAPTPRDPGIKPLPSPWDQLAPPGAQLMRLVRRHTSYRLRSALDRVRGLTGSLETKTAVIVGAGSVGSRIAEDLVRSGIQQFVIVDPDEVTPPNLARSVYTAQDIGFPKSTVLATRLRDIDADAQVQEMSCQIVDVDWSSVLAGASIVIAATDDRPQQAALSHHAYAAGVPLVACALYRKAAAGEIVISIPEANTPCWSCAIGYAGGGGRHLPDTNYGTGRLVAESALGPSINIVTSAASQTAIGILAGPQSPAGEPITRLIAEGRTLGIITTTPKWEFTAELFEGMHHQHAPQSVWPRVKRRQECPACGKHRSSPLDRAAGEKFVADLAALSLTEQSERHNQQQTTEHTETDNTT